jgi:hypothetical protein
LWIVEPVAPRKIAVGSIAEWCGAAVLAAAEDDFLISVGHEGNRKKSGAHVRTVAEGLRLRAPASAPKVTLPGFDLVVEALAMRD